MREDYLLYRKRRFAASAALCENGETFLSAFNSSPRVRAIFDAAAAAERHWVVLPEYGFARDEYPDDGNILECARGAEAEVLFRVLDQLGDLRNSRLVIDATGFLNNYVMVLLPLLQARGVRHARFLYGEPVRYLSGERTKFSDEVVVQVRQVGGFEGSHNVDSSDDLLVLGMGYDWRLAAQVAVTKEHARKIQLFGLPSLQLDMYQESVLCASRAADEIGPEAANPAKFEFAPAHDPFVTAGIISGLVDRHRSQHPNANVYLAPLATKTQALGFALYYLREARETATSIIYPVCESYMKATSEGLAGVWDFDVELEDD